MKMLPLVAAAAALLIASGAVARQPRGGSPAPANCPLTAGFSSYGAGIDRGSFEAVERLLRRDRAVRAVTQHGWGREGEVTLCARTRTARDASRLFQAIRALLPARPRGPISVSTLNGAHYQTPSPRR